MYQNQDSLKVQMTKRKRLTLKLVNMQDFFNGMRIRFLTSLKKDEVKSTAKI
jgi:hypothetical protein